MLTAGETTHGLKGKLLLDVPTTLLHSGVFLCSGSLPSLTQILSAFLVKGFFGRRQLLTSFLGSLQNLCTVLLVPGFRLQTLRTFGWR